MAEANECLPFPAEVKNSSNYAVHSASSKCILTYSGEQLTAIYEYNPAVYMR
jgi:hypothetical protein